MRLGRLIALVLVAVVTAAVVPALAPAQLPDLPPLSGDPDPTAPPARETEPIVLTGQDFPNWSARSNVTARLPLVDLTKCQTFDAQCEHNHYAQPDFDTGSSLGTGAPVDKLLGYRWDGKGWHQIPFQVDEVFTRYLSNPASGFSAYSGEDQHTTYAYDREGFRWTESDPSNPCLAKPASPPAVDPVQGLDDNDELAFMASDSGGAAPAGTKPPTGIEGVRQVELRDPANPSAAPKYVYVMRAGDNGPKRTDQSYVTYKRDSISNTFEKSQSNYDSYGNAATGVYCDANGNIVRKADGTPDIQRRRPRDYATVKTSRYRFRYDGRWLLTQLHISPDGGKTFGPDLVDRWKARAFAQDRASETPCCGYEEEDNNWGGSSTLLGERSGPVRTIRETWGADSGTNVIRRETFYRDEMRMKTWLRVHVIPPLDGIYAQWDFNAGRVNTFYNSKKPAGVPIDGRNDEMFGNLDDPCNDNWDVNDTSAIDQGYRSAYRQFQLCNAPYHQSVDLFDPTMTEANVALGWSEVAGPNGTIVDRYHTSVKDLTPGGAAQSVVATPYYRDDSCFDDGTGSDPGPRINTKQAEEQRTASDGSARRCWKPSDGVPDGSDKFFQGSIGTHGVHILFQVDSDNARMTVPISEIVSEQRMVMLPGDPGNVGAQYGTAFAQPLAPTAAPGARGDDGIAPTVKVAVRRRGKSAARVRWRGADRGGSGVRSYALQVRRGKKGKWRTIRRNTHGLAYTYRAHKSGRFEFRVRATDRAGNRGRWAGRAVKLSRR